MARALTQAISNQISSQRVGVTFIFKINSVDLTDYVKDWTISADRNFGSNSGLFILNNADAIFSSGGLYQISVGDVIEFIETYTGDSTQWKRFYGKVDKRSLLKQPTDRTITLNCLDYISVLKTWDVDMITEGTKVEITNENLKPNYLSAPNDMFAQIFDFANDSIAAEPAPILMIRDKLHQTDDPQFDGFDILYDSGQVKFGAPLNARDNNDVIARSYWFYTQGLYAEDVLEDLLTEPDGYGNYLFDEASSEDVINNHFKSTFQDEEGPGTLDLLTPNVTSSTITIKQRVTTAILANATSITLESIDGLPSSGSGNIAGDVFTWSNIVASTKTLTGIPASGSNSLGAHPADSYMEYSATYAAGKVWYLTYSNVETILAGGTGTDAVPTMTSATAPSGRVTTSNEIDANRAGWHAFDGLNANITTHTWTTSTFPTVGSPHWIKYEFPVAKRIGTYKITSRVSTPKAPKDWTFQGSNDDVNWTVLDTQTDQFAGDPTSTTVTYNIGNRDAYKFYRLHVTDGRDATVSNLGIGEMEFIETNDFSGLGTANVIYFDRRFGRIILDTAISILSVVRCNYNYTFKTLQATGIELNKIAFRSRELENRFEAIQKLRKYLAPNYIIRTQGDNKIWANFLYQKTNPDYTLSLIQTINYLEDDDLFTRVVFFGKNKNPTNAMFDEGVDFETTGQSYKALASQNELDFQATENGFQVYKSAISNAGYIVGDFFTPLVYINGIPIDNQLHQMIAQPLSVESTTRTETTTESSKFSGTDVTVRTFYYYRVLFAHQNIDPAQSITCYNATGTAVFTISPGDSQMDYGRGIYNAPGNQQNSTMESLATATYWVRYSTNALQIDYSNVTFRINASILPDPVKAKVTATYEYYTVFTPARGVGAIIDGRWDTQVQTEFFAEPPNGYVYAIIDLGQIRTIQAIDIVAGFYKPDNIRKFDIDMRLSLQYSTDNVGYHEISDETHNFRLTGGESVSFDEDKLGIGFEARYIQVVLENVAKVEYGDGVWPVAFTEVSVYEDVIIKSEATLIATSYLLGAINSATTTINVVDTSQFTEPASGETETAYINGGSFSYSALTATSFLGCIVSSGTSGILADYVYQDLETDTTVYDNDSLRAKLGDRLYKEVRISDDVLYTQAQLDSLAKAYLEEFVKDHTKLTVNIVYAPYLKVGQTVALTDPYNDIIAVNYFIEQISESNGFFTLTLARYPA